MDELTLVCTACNTSRPFRFGGPGPALANYMRKRHRVASPGCGDKNAVLHLYLRSEQRQLEDELAAEIARGGDPV